jgi:HEAT repeat protein
MHIKTFFPFTTIILVFFLAACQTTNLPASPTTPAQPAQTNTPAASPTPASAALVFPSSAWQAIELKKLCLDVKENYSEELAYSTAEIHREKAALLLQALGFQTAAAAQTCDATLEVSLSYSVNSATYDTNNDTSFDCIVGANFSGLMLLSAPGQLPLYQEVSGEFGNAPVVTTNGCPDQVYAFNSGWNKLFLENISNLTGPHVITYLYHSEDKTIRNAALAASEALGPDDTDVLPEVIEALKAHHDYAGQIGTGLQRMGPDAQLAAQEIVPGLVQALQGGQKDLPEGIDPGMLAQPTIETIGKFGPAAAQAAPVLLEILQDADMISVQTSAIIALGEIGPDAADAIPALMELTSDPFVGSDAAAALGKIGPANPEVLSFLIEKAKSKTSSLTGMTGLAEMTPSADIVKALIEIYKDKAAAAYKRSQAIDMLGSMAATSPEALQAIISAGTDSDPGVAAAALAALGKLGPLSPDILPVIKKALSRSDDSVQMTAANALGSFGPEAVESIPTLIAMIKSPKQISLARLGAISALGRLGQASPEVISTLAGALKTAPDEAALALEQLGPAARPAIPDLIQALHEENVNPDDYGYHLPFVRALVAVTGEYHGFKAEDWQTWWDAQPKE